MAHMLLCGKKEEKKKKTSNRSSSSESLFTITASMTSTPPTDEEVLRGLCNNEDVYSLCIVWEILQRRIPGSLMSSRPTSRDTPKFWALDQEALSFTEDKKWLLKHLRGHRVVPMRHQFFERVDASCVQ
jgi:hypothetical protein